MWFFFKNLTLEDKYYTAIVIFCLLVSLKNTPVCLLVIYISFNTGYIFMPDAYFFYIGLIVKYSCIS